MSEARAEAILRDITEGWPNDDERFDRGMEEARAFLARGMVPVPHCWTCGVEMTADEYRTAVREVADESKRWCIDCHYTVEMSNAPLVIGNMLRHVAGLPLVIHEA